MNIKTFVSDKMGENTYIAQINDKFFIVDPGEFSPDLERYLDKIKDKVEYILLTHSHFDHIGGLLAVQKICKDAKTVVHTADKKGLSDPILSLTSLFGIKDINAFCDITVEDKSELLIGNNKISVLHTPGHTRGSVCYFINDVLFSGDTLFKESYGRTDFPGGDTLAIAKSLHRLSLLDGKTKVFSGHGEVTTIDYEKKFNPGMTANFWDCCL